METYIGKKKKKQAHQAKGKIEDFVQTVDDGFIRIEN